MTAIEWTETTWLGGSASSLPGRVLDAPCIDLGFRPERGAADLDGFGEVGRSVGEVVDALRVDAEPLRCLLGRQVTGNLHGLTVSAHSRSATAILRVGQLLERYVLPT